MSPDGAESTDWVTELPGPGDSTFGYSDPEEGKNTATSEPPVNASTQSDHYNATSVPPTTTSFADPDYIPQNMTVRRKFISLCPVPVFVLISIF